MSNVNDLEKEKFGESGGEVGVKVILIHGDEWKAGVANLAALPGSGNTTGDLRQTLDTGIIYRWNGSAWVAFEPYWDSVNERLGVGTTTPTIQLEVYKASNVATLGTYSTSGASNTAALLLQSDGTNNLNRIISQKGAGDATQRPLSIMVGAGEVMRFLSTGNIGLLTSTPTNILSFGGNAARKIWLERHTTANTLGNSLTIEAGGSTSGATDKSGGTLFLNSGISTGSARGYVMFGTSIGGSAGVTDNNPITQMVLMATSTGALLMLKNSATFETYSNCFAVNGENLGYFVATRRVTANSAGQATSVIAGSATAAATDKNGGTLILMGGTSTGTGTSAVQFYTSSAGSTGTADNTPTVKMTLTGAGRLGINETIPDYLLDVNGSFGITPGIGSTITPVDNGDLTIETTSNTTLTFRLKGSDGTVRSGTVTLA